MNVIKKLWIYIKDYKLPLFAGIILLILFTALGTIGPYISKLIVDRVIIGHERNLLTPLLIVLGTVTVLRAAVRYGQLYALETVSQNTIYRLRHDLYQKLQGMSFDFFNKSRTGELMSRMTGDLEAIRHWIAAVITGLLEAFLFFTAVMVILFSLNPLLTLACLLISPFMCILSIRVSRETRSTFGEIRRQFAVLNSAAQENIAGVRIVRSFNRENYEMQKFDEKNSGFKRKRISLGIIFSKYFPKIILVSNIPYVILIIFGGLLTIKGYITVGTFVAFNGYIWMMVFPLRILGWLLADTQRAIASGEMIFTLLATDSEIKNPPDAVARNRFDGHVVFKNVSLVYDGKKVLDNICINAHPGMKIAIMGATGTGKTSIINLIGRYYDCTSGCVKIDGLNVKSLDLHSLRKNIAVVMQDIFLFSDTIEGNIAFGNPDASMEQIKNAAVLARAHDFIMQMPEGYDTVVGERGIGLSGGQKQRISIARALLVDAPIVILDDASSSVDMETELEIQQTLQEAFKDKTVFIIGHRISSVKDADEIIMLGDGRITEHGTHHELLKMKGLYYDIFSSQYSEYREKIAAEEVLS